MSLFEEEKVEEAIQTLKDIQPKLKEIIGDSKFILEVIIPI